MAENTFLGLQPYTEADAYRFKGRTEESQELFRLIVRNDYTVCYAESGEGKTSLLNAGVFPLLRQNMYFPIAITFTNDDYQHTPDSFDTIIDRCIRDSIVEYNETNKGINIEYKLCSTDFQDKDRQSALQQELSKYSWWKLRNYKPQAMGLTFTPVFVFDQFEEVFNLPGSIVWTKKFFDWLENVSSDSCPDDIIEKVRSIIGTNAAFPAIKEEKDFKAIFSLRKEFIGELDYWGMQKCFIPSLKDNRYCLKALTYEGAKKVMFQQQRFEEAKVEQVLHYFVQQYSREPEKTIAENLPVIPALLLSVVCESWEKDIDSFSGKDENEIGQSINRILERFYDEALSSITNELSLQEVNSHAEAIREDIESAIFALVDSNGKRVRRKTTELTGFDFDTKYKQILSKNRIIKLTKVEDEDYVEIVHDSLCTIIAHRKGIRLAEEAKKREEEKIRERVRKRNMRLRIIITCVFCLLAIGITAVLSRQKQELEKANQELEKANQELQYARIQAEEENANLTKAHDAIMSLNAILESTNDSLNRQKEELNHSFHEQQRLAQSLKEQNIELEKRMKIIKEQRDEIISMNQIIDSISSIKPMLQTSEIELKLLLGYSDNTNLSNEEGASLSYSSQLLSLAESGNASAQNLLGYCFLEGNGVMVDYQKALFWLKKAAEQGNLKAINSLGTLFEKGLGVSKDESQAFSYYEKAALRGMPNAFVNLAQCYYNGVGTEKDLLKARAWFEKGAEFGYRVAQTNVGYLYLEEKNYNKAFYWLNEAADQGSPNALEMLGMCYENGWGTEVDRQKAKDCYRKSYLLGNQQAKERLEEIEDKNENSN